MFDVSFTELLVIGLVALVVIGPERLPGVARTLGHLLGRLNRYVNGVKADIQREMHLDEMRKLRDEMEQQARQIEQSVTREAEAVRSSLDDLEKQARQTLAPEQGELLEAPDRPGASSVSPPASSSSPVLTSSVSNSKSS